MVRCFLLVMSKDLYPSLSVANDGCETGEVRLVGGVANASSGVVELCVDGVWGTICDRYYEWGHENAAVVCRQLNLPVDGESLSNRRVLPPYLAHLIVSLNLSWRDLQC